MTSRVPTYRFDELAIGDEFDFYDELFEPEDYRFNRKKLGVTRYVNVREGKEFEWRSITTLVVKKPEEKPEVVETNRWYENKNAEKVTNEKGGQQSKLACQWRRIDPEWLKGVAVVLTEAATKKNENGEIRYPDDPDGTPNWHYIDTIDHLEHLVDHALAAIAIYQNLGIGEVAYTDYKAIQEHMEHVGCRAMFAHNAMKREYLANQYDG